MSTTAVNPQSIGDHPAPQRLTRNQAAMLLRQLLGRDGLLLLHRPRGSYRPCTQNKTVSHCSLSTLIMQQPRWQGDGRPHWLEGKGKRWERSCKTADETTKLRTLTILRLHRLGMVEADVLAERLTTCTPSNPCASGACPVCGRSHQRWLVNQRQKLIARQSDEKFQIVSLIPDFGACPWDQISGLDVAAIRLRVVRALGAAGIKFAFAGIDFSMNIDHEDDEWYLQFQFLLFTPDITEHCKQP